MNIETFTKEKGTLLKVSGRMDAITAPDFESKCLDLLKTGQVHLVADFRALEYISSAGLRAILAAAKTLKAQNGTISFCGVSGMVLEVFNISGFERMFSLADSSEELWKKLR